ncbi:uncharacterized protein LOC143349806 [Colletes latitarsis]|uniref:uncharacterized protein LOC143349806 n=1 Tax=Colletes latitarsis TaxID=2605962 RepID=UPI004035C5D9
MARTSLCIVPVCLVLLVAWADDRAFLAGENERRWNTPPELIPEQVNEKSDVKNERSLSIPITANINLNTGNNAHSLGFQVGPEGFGYSESNSFSHPTVSQSQSLSFAAGPSGVAGSISQAAVNQYYPVHGNQGNLNNQAPGFVNGAAASSSGTVQNGHATSSASSSAGTIILSEGMHIRFPEQGHRQPIWTNIHPNHNNNGPHASRVPKLDITIEPQQHQRREPIMLHISTQQTQWENRKPTVHIRKWHPTYRSYYDF